VHETWPLCEVRMYDHVEHGHERCCPFPPGTRSVCIYKYILSVSAGGLISYPTILSMTGTVKLLILDSCGQRCRSPPKAVFHGSGWRGVIAVISWSRWQLQLLGHIVILEAGGSCTKNFDRILLKPLGFFDCGNLIDPKNEP